MTSQSQSDLFGNYLRHRYGISLLDYHILPPECRRYIDACWAHHLTIHGDEEPRAGWAWLLVATILVLVITAGVIIGLTVWKIFGSP